MRNMTLKKNALRSSAEHLYMLEVFVNRLILQSSELLAENAENLIVSIRLADVEPLEIKIANKYTDGNRKGKGANDQNPVSALSYIVINRGKSCLFTRTLAKLRKGLKCTPMSIEVHREKCSYLADVEKSLLCAANVYLPERFCHHVCKFKGKSNGLFRYCSEKNTYDLTDHRGLHRASISIFIKLTCLGGSLARHFALNDKSLVLEDCPLRDNSRCSNTTGQMTDDEERALKRPKSPPRIAMNEPGFEGLTSAEKLNDRQYRDLIYRAYPDEPTCRCLPTDRSTHPMTCRSGCNHPCCMKLRNPKSMLARRNDAGGTTTSPILTRTYCIDDAPSKFIAAKTEPACRRKGRLRGGGDTEYIYRLSKLASVEDGAWIDTECTEKFSEESRLKGGGGEQEGSSCVCSAGAPSPQQGGSTLREGTTAQSACKPRSRPTDVPGCVCSGKESSAHRRGSSKCTKKPCMGVDCLIKAFKEAQDFVDSLGKVPGFAGLGLMDPTESPFFGRDIDADYTSQETQLERRRGQPSPQLAALNSQCTAPCNAQAGRTLMGVSGGAAPYVAPASPTIAVPGRTGVVREAAPALPDTNLTIVPARHKKREEKKDERLEKQKELLDATSSSPLDIDVGPCGEPKCKSRRKRPVENVAQSETTELSQKRAAAPIRPPSTPTPKSGSKASEKGRHQRTKHGPAGDRNTVGKTPIKVSKRVMRYIYTIGDVYPGINYGHKNCIDPRLRVPANMGWLWNTSSTADKLKPRIGWKPGAIGRYLNELLKEAKAGSLQEDNRPRSVPSRTKRARVYRSMSFSSVKKLQTKKEIEEEVEAPPTLHIHRKDGTYYVTMYPIKQETSDEPRLDEPTKPLQFKIVKNKDDESVASSSTASDMEIEFSPPAAVNRYRKKPDVIHVDTQVRQQEILDAFKSSDSLKKKEKKVKKEKKGKK
ncbi:hypothetical protein KM043_009849 [Ampulex compressa]|nr:hypothetical protein KM043_009849 [Ampulex compressa]